MQPPQTPRTPPAGRAPDFSAGASAPKPAPPQRRARRALRAVGWLLLGLVALLLAGAAALWWWTGSNTSLAATLARAALHLPADQQLESREVSGSLRRGGQIGWLRWSSPGLTVEVTDIRIGWQLAPLLQRRLALGEVHAARVQITPHPRTEPEPSKSPMSQLVLPLQVGLPFRVDEIQWAGTPAVQAHHLVGDYRFNGQAHALAISRVELAQGHYSANATLQARAPMALDATVDGAVRAAAPGDGTPLALLAHATLQGTLATAAAQLSVAAHITPDTPAAPAQAAASSAPPGNSPPLPANAAAHEAMQAQLQATVEPWAEQPLVAAMATLRAVDLSALWPQAPATQLHGSVEVSPAEAAPPGPQGWALRVDLRNERAGPWDQRRLPLTALQARGSYDGNRWSVPNATASVGSGTATAQGHYTPATGAVDGQAELRALRPDALHTDFAAAPLSGTVRARMQGDAVRFNADIRAAAGAATSRHAAGLLRINTLAAEGTWQRAATGPAAGTLVLERLVLDALQAQMTATRLRLMVGDSAVQDAQGQVALSVPGTTARAQGQAGPRRGGGELQLQVQDAERTQRWLGALPFVGQRLQEAFQGYGAAGNATLQARWTGGWQTLAQQLQAVGAGAALPEGSDRFALQANLTAPQLDVTRPPAPGTNAATQPLMLRGATAELNGTLAQATLALRAERRTPAPQPQRAAVQARIAGGLAGPGRWQAQVSELQLQAQLPERPDLWTLTLAEPTSITVRTGTTQPGRAAGTAPAAVPGGWAVEAGAGAARLTGPLPGTVQLRWQPLRAAAPAAAGALPRLQSQGTLQGLPLAWLDALGLGETPAAGGRPAQPLLARVGLASSLVLDGQWNIDTTQPGGPRVSATLGRASGDLRILAGDATSVTAVQSSGTGAGPGAVAVIATETTDSAAPRAGTAAGTAAGVRQAEITVQAEGETLRARLQWASERAGEINATVNTRLAWAAGGTGAAGSPADAGVHPLVAWPETAPLQGSLRALLPDVGVWSALAPPGWRVRGTLDASATLSGTRNAPRWSGTLGADNMAVRSVVDGVDLQGGRLRATLQGNELQITDFRLQGGRGSNARIVGFSGNRTAAPQDGGVLTGTGRIAWTDAGGGLSGISMSLQAEARALQVLVRADRQVSVSGQVQAQLQQGQLSLRGKLTTDRATIILPDESAPRLGPDVVVRSAAKDREDQARAQAAAKANQAAAQVDTAKPPDIAITLNLGNDFALQGQGITTRLTGEVDIRSSSVRGAPPRVTGEVRTDEGRYRAWGQVLDVETGLIRFNGPYNNPSLDILALRPNISVRAGVQITGSAQAPRVKLYSDPELPDAEKLSWVVLGRNAAAGGAEAAVLQQAALALLGRGGNNTTANIASRFGLDEIGFRGAAAGQDASTAALTFGKRLSRDLYVTYERSLSGTLGTLYIFYDLTRRLTLRGQTGEKSAVDLIYTVKYD